ncbi:MAG: response regulator [Leptospiraceae bacterium]|nr:response regulator [Leptospiraceae bacterium]MCP5512563.1 response regulator [Leptospiraceae bacterium]
MINKRILLAEDEAPIRNFISKAIKQNNYDITVAENGKEAWDLHCENPFPLILTDLAMPIMKGEELIELIQTSKIGVPPTIIVMTSQDDIKKVIEIMKLGVYDYLIKPVNLPDLMIKISHAFKYHELNQLSIAMEKEKEIRLQEQLNWIKYKEDLKGKDTNKFKNNVIHNMKHNLGQSGGIGTLLTLVDLVYQTAKEDGDNYIIGKDTFNLIKENAEILDHTLNALEEISYISENPVTMETGTVMDVFNLLKEEVDKMDDFSLINYNTIVISDPKPSFSEFTLEFHREYLQKMFHEVLINACKFSETNTNIVIFLRLESDKLIFSFLNQPSADLPILGIPIEYSNLVFEPFYRIAKFVKEKYHSLDLGFGLPMVKSIIKKHNGNVSISNLKDFTSLKDNLIKVNLEIDLPITKK